MDILTKLQNWYKTQCNGDWEHGSGIVIQSTDNPGWWVKINLKETSLENKVFNSILKNVTQLSMDQAMGKVKAPFVAEEPLDKNDWMSCYIHNNIFNDAEILPN